MGIYTSLSLIKRYIVKKNFIRLSSSLFFPARIYPKIKSEITLNCINAMIKSFYL